MGGVRATPEVVMQREIARAAHTLTNFLRWIRRSEEQRIEHQLQLERRVWDYVTPDIKTVGGMCNFYEQQATPLREWRKAVSHHGTS